ncbi:hypothetical protein D7Z54_02360 [Salibacterium salarium]|uniref:Uncharacterized protein n=1 Tax=Salibacterium salarium TaxID=284579 RepID=A0A3R9RG67_9BACI|nr:hypothetical protein D7Z54_02360 [Salibacterium salarium]
MYQSRHLSYLLQEMIQERRNGSMTVLRNSSFWHRHARRNGIRSGQPGQSGNGAALEVFFLLGLGIQYPAAVCRLDYGGYWFLTQRKGSSLINCGGKGTNNTPQDTSADLLLFGPCPLQRKHGEPRRTDIALVLRSESEVF